MNESQRKALRQQIAAVMARAQVIAGSRERLAEFLRVSPIEITNWLLKRDDAPATIVDKAVALIVENLLPPPEPPSPPPSPGSTSDGKERAPAKTRRAGRKKN